METLFYTSINSPIVIILTIIYFFTSAITTFDIRMIQAVKSGLLTPDEAMLPKWINWVYWLHWVVFISLVFLNWKFAIFIFVIKFILKVLPVLEVIGNVLMSPFKQKK